MADFWEFSTLGFILGIARWAGAPSQEELRRQYSRARMQKAVRRLASSADILAEVLIEMLIEIAEISDEIGDEETAALSQRTS